MKKILLLLLGILVLLLAVIAFNTFRFKSRQVEAEPLALEPVAADAPQHLAQAIRIKTISPENPADFDSAQFAAFRNFLQQTYPLSDSLLNKKVINQFSLLYKWQGSNRSLKPIILLGHLDVVPVAEETLQEWKAAPFSGEIKDGIIWGRGAIDDKLSVIAILEAAEMLLKSGYQPERTVYFAFGHDEEIGGRQGAQAIVKQLQQENVQAEFVLDEGYAITQGMVPGVSKDVALIGIAEKGFASLELSVQVKGGHSSMPQPETAIDVLSRAITKIKEDPLPAQISPPVEQFITHIGPEMPAVQKAVFANAAIFKPLILNIYQKTPSGNALVSTTVAPTIFRSGLKENIIPQQASAIVNFRILPGTSIKKVTEHVKEVMDDERIQVRLRDFHSEASPVSSTESKGYEVLNKTIRQVFPEAVTAPSLVLAATDSRFYQVVSDNVYRFAPHYINKENITSFHGVNERMPVQEFENAIRFYAQLIRNGSK